MLKTATSAAEPKQKWQTIHAVVTRADGTIEDRGLIAFSHRNPIVNAVGNLYVKATYWFGEKRRACLKWWRSRP